MSYRIPEHLIAMMTAHAEREAVAAEQFRKYWKQMLNNPAAGKGTIKFRRYSPPTPAQPAPAILEDW